jgi:hypothetical protein
MSEVQNNFEMRRFEFKLQRRYTRLSVLFLLLGIILFFWVIMVYLGILFWDYGHNWAGLTLEQWVIVASIIIAVFIIIELIFYKLFLSSRYIAKAADKPGPNLIDGKRVVNYTYPQGIEGGIFSKTYLHIDDKTTLRLRTLMIPPEDLWGEKKGKDKSK